MPLRGASDRTRLPPRSIRSWTARTGAPRHKPPPPPPSPRPPCCRSPCTQHLECIAFACAVYHLLCSTAHRVRCMFMGRGTAAPPSHETRRLSAPVPRGRRRRRAARQDRARREQADLRTKNEALAEKVLNPPPPPSIPAFSSRVPGSFQGASPQTCPPPGGDTHGASGPVPRRRPSPPRAHQPCGGAPPRPETGALNQRVPRRARFRYKKDTTGRTSALPGSPAQARQAEEVRKLTARVSQIEEEQSDAVHTKSQPPLHTAFQLRRLLLIGISRAPASQETRGPAVGRLSTRWRGRPKRSSSGRCRPRAASPSSPSTRATRRAPRAPRCRASAARPPRLHPSRAAGAGAGAGAGAAGARRPLRSARAHVMHLTQPLYAHLTQPLWAQVLFLPTTGGDYVAFHRGCPRRFLSPASLATARAQAGGARPDFVVGRVVEICPAEARAAPPPRRAVEVCPAPQDGGRDDAHEAAHEAGTTHPRGLMEGDTWWSCTVEVDAL